ncbi:MAG: flagellar basal body rod protein FlgC [Caldilineaceae bacterium]|nr:flagellar basal body rod protein FlgC [Caldilineaceae bacterium]
MSSIFRSMRISATALTSERLRMDVISNNIANSQTTRTDEGGAFKRKRVVFQAQEDGVSSLQRMRGPGTLADVHNLQGVRVRRIVESDEDMVRTYDPNHPDADADGFVEYPNVDISTEMVDLMAASKAYQSNITVIQTAKTMAQAALQIGK